jgi:hypothetical protein
MMIDVSSESSLSLTTLPFNFYTEIQNFLYLYDYRRFLNISNSSHFREIKKSTLVLHLKEDYSDLYCTNDVFRERVLKVIADTKQLMLIFNNKEVPPDYFQFFHDLRQLKCGSLNGNNEITEVSLFYNNYRLDLRYLNKLQNCDGMKNITELELFLCSQLNDISALASIPSLRYVCMECCSLITNVDSLRNIPIVHIYKCTNILSMSNLGGPLQREVYLHDLPKVTDIASFAKLKIFSMSYIPLITDISMLGNIRKLSMSYLDLVPTLKGLDNVRIMMMHSMEIMDYSPLKNLTSLTLTYCNSICDFSCFVSLTFLSVAYCNGVKSLSSLSALHKLKKVIMRGLPELYEIGKIENPGNSITFLEISECPIRSVEGLGSIRNLKLQYCKELKSLDGLIPSSNYDVEIVKCHEIKDFSPLTNCYQLRIHDCNGFSSLQGVENIEYGVFIKLNITSFSFIELKGAKKIVFSQCPLLTEIKGLKNVEMCIIDDGRKVVWKLMN